VGCVWPAGKRSRSKQKEHEKLWYINKLLADSRLDFNFSLSSTTQTSDNNTILSGYKVTMPARGKHPSFPSTPAEITTKSNGLLCNHAQQQSRAGGVTSQAPSAISFAARSLLLNHKLSNITLISRAHHNALLKL
jgi:hypothetical protein